MTHIKVGYLLDIASKCFNQGDYVQAKEYYEKSLEIEETVFAHYGLATIYRNGLGCKQDYVRAKEHYEESLEIEESATAYHHLAYLYECGLGCKQDYFKAKELYEKSLEIEENAAAYYNLACLYAECYDELSQMMAKKMRA